MFEKPIGIFDSGLGGISVLNQCKNILPQEDFIYFADKKNSPYGDKQPEDIVKFMIDVMDNFFVKKNVKAVVVACNTATNIAIEELRKRYNFPIIGIEPAIKPALINSDCKNKVLVLATDNTVKSKKFLQHLNKYDKSKCIVMGCSGLVELIEANDKRGIEVYLDKKFKEIDKNQISSVVLGCTHYPFIINEIRKKLNKDVTFYDGGYGVAKRLKNILEDKNIIALHKRMGFVDVHSSSNDEYNKKLLEYVSL